MCNAQCTSPVFRINPTARVTFASPPPPFHLALFALWLLVSRRIIELTERSVQAVVSDRPPVAAIRNTDAAAVTKQRVVNCLSDATMSQRGYYVISVLHILDLYSPKSGGRHFRNCCVGVSPRDALSTGSIRQRMTWRWRRVPLSTHQSEATRLGLAQNGLVVNVPARAKTMCGLTPRRFI